MKANHRLPMNLFSHSYWPLAGTQHIGCLVLCYFTAYVVTCPVDERCC